MRYKVTGRDTFATGANFCAFSVKCAVNPAAADSRLLIILFSPAERESQKHNLQFFYAACIACNNAN